MTALTQNFVRRLFRLPENATDSIINQITTDSRTAQRGDLFFALVGENHDAHDFVPEVLAKGATAVVSRGDCAELSGCLKVDDTLAALQTLAAAWRKQLNPFVYGITGSSGKTTVKEMLATILRTAHGADAVLATVGNFNNHIGLPLTLLNLREPHRHAVIEMGMNHAGELAMLTRIAAPNVALVNNAMRAHIGCGFNGVDDIARAKAEIYQGLPENGIAILPAEDAHLAIFQAAARAFQTLTFGATSGDVHAENIVLEALSSAFDLVYNGNRQAVQLPVAGNTTSATLAPPLRWRLQAASGSLKSPAAWRRSATSKGGCNAKTASAKR